MGFDYGEVLMTDPLSGRGQKADATVKVHHGIVSGSDQACHPFKEPRNEMAIALEKGTDGNFESDGEIHADSIPAPSGEDLR